MSRAGGGSEGNKVPVSNQPRDPLLPPILKSATVIPMRSEGKLHWTVSFPILVLTTPIGRHIIFYILLIES